MAFNLKNGETVKAESTKTWFLDCPFTPAKEILVFYFRFRNRSCATFGRILNLIDEEVTTKALPETNS